jgi:hypothetical protein
MLPAKKIADNLNIKKETSWSILMRLPRNGAGT